MEIMNKLNNKHTINNNIIFSGCEFSSNRKQAQFFFRF